MSEVAALLGGDGPLAAAIPDFRVRPQQQAMADAVADAIDTGGVLVCEAGTGTGKTFAYLVPALASGRRVIVSTGTRTLQDQLFHRDLPLVSAALALGGSSALLKGRANYLCLHRLEQAGHDGLPLGDEHTRALAQVREWARRTEAGDIAELAEVPEASGVWPLVTSTVDNCLGQDCPRYRDCHVVQARRAAAAADVVVVNHHLFLADMTLREDGTGEILPGADVVIFDEAHQLPDLAAEFFGSAISSRQIADLARDVAAAQAEEAREARDLPELAREAELAAADLRAALGPRDRREDWAEAERPPGVAPALALLTARVERLADALAAHAERGAQLTNVARRAGQIEARLALFGDAGSGAAVRWVETRRRAWTLHRTPLDVAGVFQERLARYRSAFVYTSATLAVGESFDYFAGRLGIADAVFRRWESPYDFDAQALLYLPRIGVAPGDAGYTRAVCEAAVPVLRASRGRAFVLFTSHRALQEAAGLLADALDYPLLVQGSAARGELLERFRRTAHAVLLGTASFWEGVDVRGEQLSCVIIDKLPFAAPDDPMLRARSAALREAGGNPFVDYQLPEAIIALKQGVGRLLRDDTDRGVLVLCDPRILGKPYGRAFLRGLPPMPITRGVGAVERFFDGVTASAAVAGDD